MTEDYTQPLTPPRIEEKMRRLVNQLALAQVELARERDAEVDLKHAYDSARRRLILSSECPRVTRGGWTVDERDAWVDSRVEEERRAYDVQVARREAAADRLRTLRDQAVLVSSLAKSVQITMGLAGRIDP